MIPTVDDLKSDVMVHRFGDLYNPPGLTNFWGAVQADIDITGIRSVNFPPFGCSDTITCGLYFNDKYFPSTGTPVKIIWYADKIMREAVYSGIKFSSVTLISMKKKSVLVRLQLENISGYKQDFELRLGLAANVTKAVKAWNEPFPPVETDNRIEIDTQRNALLFSSQHSTAFSLQGAMPKAGKADKNNLYFKIELNAGEQKAITFVDSIGDNLNEVQSEFDMLINNADKFIKDTNDEWNEELRSAFTPGNSRFSGFMPELETADEEVLKIYNLGILGLIYFKRDNPYSVFGRAYDTLMPRYWQSVTFIWDYALSSVAHALLDPAVMRKYLELWMSMDIHKHFGIEYLTGSPVGPWYSVNDFALTWISRNYLKWTGDTAWLKKELDDRQGNKKTVFDFLIKYSRNWKQFKTINGLADYGGINNLLECVSTYIHEVASLNAGNIFNLRTAAELLEGGGDSIRANEFYNEARLMLKEVNKLYADGKGFWNARFPDGELVEVRHCYDFITILNTIAADLSNKQKEEMTEFFVRELQTKTWMRALSPGDNNVMFSVRPDHQWNGAYPAWPAQAVTGLYKIGRGDIAFKWLKGLAKSANQGPFGQAHFVEDVIEPESGGARKASPEGPFICDWTVSSSGSWTNIIIESIFGVEASVYKGISANPQFGLFDAGAELKNLSYQGKLYSVNKNGLTEINGK